MRTSSTVLCLIFFAFSCGGGPKVAESPKNSSQANTQEEPQGLSDKEALDFRDSQPTPGPARDFQLPSINVFEISSPGKSKGKKSDPLKVYLVENHALPTVSIEFDLDGGSRNDPKSKSGLAGLCMNLLSEATKKDSKEELSRKLSRYASGVYSAAGEDNQTIGMYTLSKYFDETLALFEDVVLRPGLRKEDLERLSKTQILGIKQAKASPVPIAGRVADRIFYGTQHPFGHVTTEKTIKRIGLSDCKKFHQAYVRPGGARVFVVGDMTKQQVVEKLKPLLKKWKGSPKRSVEIGPPKGESGKIFFVDVPGAAQSAVYLVHEGPTRSDKNYFANRLMGNVLGGGFASRLNMNLREDKGYSYGASGGFSYQRNHGSFFAYSSVRADATGQSLVEIMDEMKSLHSGKEPVKKDELSREKNGAILGLPASFATSRSILAQFQSLVYFGLPLDYYQGYVSAVKKVALADVNAAAVSALHPKDVRILIVGDSKAVQKIRKGDKDVPLTEKGKSVTLEQMLEGFAKTQRFGPGTLVLLDADGEPKK